MSGAVEMEIQLDKTSFIIFVSWLCVLRCLMIARSAFPVESAESDRIYPTPACSSVKKKGTWRCSRFVFFYNRINCNLFY